MGLGKGLRGFTRGRRTGGPPGSAYFVSLGWGSQRGHPQKVYYSPRNEPGGGGSLDLKEQKEKERSTDN